jgi:D-lactate dehydrogenase
MAKVVFFEVEDWEREYINSTLADYQPVLIEERLEDSTMAKYQDAEAISTFIYSTLTKEVLEKLPNLKFIATRSTGYDHIDLNYCKERGIKVANVPTYGEHTVAEHAFGLILAISRKILAAVEKAKSGDFTPEGLEGFDLFGKTLGVVGAGHIGKNVIKLGRAFGMNVLVFSKHVDGEFSQDQGIKFVDLDTLFSASDIITLHVPATKETEHMINMGNIEKIKKGAILINTARGSLIETQAILEALDKGILSAAGLDVLEEECDFREERELLTTEFFKTCDIKTALLNHVLLTRKDVVITPHNAFNSKEALQQIIETSIGNIKGYISGAPVNIVE